MEDLTQDKTKILVSTSYNVVFSSKDSFELSRLNDCGSDF